MRVAANWFPALARGRAIGIIGTGYQLCGALTFVISGWAAERFGWRGALYVPAGLLTLSALHMLIFLKNSPEEAAEGDFKTIGRGTIRENLVATLTNPALWFLAMSLALLDACRYGFTDWGVTHLKEVQGASVSSAAFKYAVLPLGGIAGALVCGWVTDRFLGGRRAPVICFALTMLGLLALAYNTVIQWGLAPSIVVLILIGFFVFGPQVMLVGTFPVDLARKGAAAAAAGFVNFAGYIGAAVGDKLTGHLAQHYGWQHAIWFWAACAFAAALMVGFLWRSTDARPGSGNNPETM
jgi:sugar phosphate permease